MPNKIDTVVWDADNTLWDWIGMHLTGMRSMAKKISEITGIPESEVKESMKRVYDAADSLDYKPLVQEMDVVLWWAITGEKAGEKVGKEEILEEMVKRKERREDRKRITRVLNSENDDFQPIDEGECKELLHKLDLKRGAVKETSEKEKLIQFLTSEGERFRRMTDINFAVHTVYTHKREETFKMYPFISEVLQQLREGNVRNVVLSDAPISKVIGRLKRFGIDDNFDLICARDDTKVAEEKERGKKHLGSYEDARSEVGVYETRAEQRTLYDCEKKPHANLAYHLDRSQDQIKDSVLVIGDNFEKDVGTADNNGCYGALAQYGVADSTSVAGLKEFGGPEVVHRNAERTDSELERNRVRARMGDKLVVVDDVRQIVDIVLGGRNDLKSKRY